LNRAGKSGKAIAMVTQYDVEVYQRIEALLGKKLPEYSTADEETVLVLLERVNEAQRLATRELKEQLAAAASRGGGRASSGGQRKRRIGDGSSGGGDDKGLESMLQKELRQGYAGGSGGRGGTLPNQRGSGNFKNKNKQQRRR
jgi:superfamily II DNA/RNA helicase